MNERIIKRKWLLLFIAAVATPAALQAQYAISNLVNNGSAFTNNKNAETVTPAAGGIGYMATAGGIFNHGGPAAATLTVNGSGNVYDAYSGTPGNPGIDNFTGYNGAASAVEIAGNNAPLFGILNLANGAGNTVSITNTRGIYVGSQLSQSGGVITTVRSLAYTGAVHFGANATYTAAAAGDGQYINGYVSKTGTAAFTFPVGSQSGNDLRTLAISAPATATDTIAVAYWSGDVGTAIDPTGGAHSRTALSTAGVAGSSQLVSVSGIGFWDWIPVSGTDPVTITVSIPDFTGAGGYATPAAMRLAGWNTTTAQWENLSGTNGAVAATEGTSLSGTMNNMSQYSALAIGNVQSVPLPVKMESFTVTIGAGCQAEFSWTTSFENDMLQYLPQYSTDGSNFTDAGSVAAVNGKHTYVYQFSNPQQGIGYYRIKSVEKNGAFSYSKTIVANSACNTAAMITAVPNPADEAVTVIGIKAGANIVLRDIYGQVLQQANSKGNEHKFSLQQLMPGMYMITVSFEGITTILRVIKK